MSDLTLKRLDNGTSIVLKFGGELDEKHTSNLSSLPVLYTGQPLTKYQYSASTYNVSGARLYNKGASVVSDYAWLLSTIKPLKEGSAPPLLSLTYNDLTLDRLYVTSLGVKRKMSVGGTLTLAELDIEFALSPVEPTPKKAPVTPNATSANGVALSDREQKDYADKIVAKLKTDSKKAKEVEFKPTSVVKVDAQGNVVIDGRKSGKVKDYGIQIKASATPEPNKVTKTIPTTNKPTGVTKKV